MSVADVMHEALEMADKHLTIQKRVFGKMAKQERSQFAQLQAIAKELVLLEQGDKVGLQRLQSLARRALKTPVGNPEIAKAQKKSAASRKAKVDAFKAAMAPHIAEAKASGAETLEAIAQFLNSKGLTTSRGSAFTRPIVHRLIGN
jgi:hypothetical protein